MRTISTFLFALGTITACATTTADAPAPSASPKSVMVEPPMAVCSVPTAPGASPVGTEAPADVASPPDNAERSRSGLASRVLKAGCGARRPSSFSVVKVHYSGWQADGRLFDSSITRGEPAIFPLNNVVPGWREGVKLMVEGETRRMWLPEELAYKGSSGPQGMLVFDVELIEIVQP